MNSRASFDNPLREYFENNKGRVISKWLHYFDIYHRHFQKYRGSHMTLLEIGVFQGGSMRMWKDYFGHKARIFGIDIDPKCKGMEDEQVKIFIGDQEDRRFLNEVKEQIGEIHIVIDDGGHTVSQQITSFEELYPAVVDGGVYLVEDLHTSYWKEFGGGYKHPGSFIEFSKHLIDQLNAWHSRDHKTFAVDEFTRHTISMHYYDSVLVLEKALRTPPVTKETGGRIVVDIPTVPQVKRLK